MKKTTIAILLMFSLMIISIGQAHAAADKTLAITATLVSQDPNPAITGEVMKARIGIANSGGESAGNLTLEIVPSYPFSIAAGEDSVKSAGYVRPYQGLSNDLKVIDYNLLVDKDATAGDYELKVKYYEQGSTSSSEARLMVHVQSRQSAEIIHIDQTVLLPGKQSSLKFSINNVGNAPLRGLTFNWENEEGVILPVGSDNTRNIRYIDVGDSVETEYQVIADTNADPGLYKLDLHLKYEDPINGSTREITTIAGIYVGGGTDFDVTFSENSAGQVSFTIANIGSNPASSVSVSIPEQRGWIVSGSNAVIIGNLNKGDYTVASFSMQSTSSGNFTGRQGTQGNNPAQNNAMTMNSSSNNVKVQIAYTDTMGERDVVEKEVKIGNAEGASAAQYGASFQTTRNSQPGFSSLIWYFAGAIIITAVLIFYFRHRKARMADSDAKARDAKKK